MEGGAAASRAPPATRIGTPSPTMAERSARNKEVMLSTHLSSSLSTDPDLQHWHHDAHQRQGGGETSRSAWTHKEYLSKVRKKKLHSI